MSDGLPGETRCSAPRQDRRSGARGKTYGGGNVGGVFRNDDADRLHLPDAGVRAVKDFRVSVEAHLALDFPTELLGYIREISFHGWKEQVKKTS